MSYLQDALRGRLLTAHEVEAVKVVKHVNALMVLTKRRQRVQFNFRQNCRHCSNGTDSILKLLMQVQVWAETDDLDKGETLYDRLDALISYIADGGIDLDDDPATDDRDDIYMVALQAASDYMSALGADDADLETLFNSKDDDARDEIAALVEFCWKH